MTRRRLSLSDKVAILMRQARCAICEWPLDTYDEPVEYDHEQALARGGEDTVKNLRAVHASCHGRKTRGNGATTRGSDIHEIAKTKRLTKRQEEFRRALLGAPAEKVTRSRKIPSRPFPKRPS